MNNQLDQKIEFYLNQCLPRHSFADVYKYGVLPAGKLFRPKLALASFNDSSRDQAAYNEDLWKLCTALEIHHAYTLIHDDLPAMDDDDMRRGQLSTHKKFGQWQAILAGDGLSIASFRLLSRITHPSAQLLSQISAHALGPKGLIQGQALDLSHEMNLSFENLLKTHELKTARLIQLSLVGGALLATPKVETKSLKQLWRLGYAVGVSFQLLDDLLELCDETLSQHEKDINPWPKLTAKCSNKTQKLFKTVDQMASKNIKNELALYYKKTLEAALKGQKNIETHIRDNNQLQPVMSLLNILSKTN